MTNVGRILGIVTTLFAIVGMVGFCGVVGSMFLLGAIGAGNGNRNFRQRRRF